VCQASNICVSLARGPQVIAVARTADLILMMLDCTKGDRQRYAKSQPGRQEGACLGPQTGLVRVFRSAPDLA
jgi:ribosome-interacting GTPase 1